MSVDDKAFRRCTQATLEALGVYGECPKNDLGVLLALGRHGYEAKLLFEPDYKLWKRCPSSKICPESPWEGTLKRFIEEHPTGSYVLFVYRHAMALIDGVLIDEDVRGRSDVPSALRRRIQQAYEITPRP